MSKSILRIVASAFHANVVTEESVKSRKWMHVFAMDVNAADKVSDSGADASAKTRSMEQSFWRCRLLRNITEVVGSEGVEAGGAENASREERKVAARTDFWSGPTLDVARGRDLRPSFRRIGIAWVSIVRFEKIEMVPSKEVCWSSEVDMALRRFGNPDSVDFAFGA